MRLQPVNQRIRIRIVQAGGIVLVAMLLLTHPALTGDMHEAIELVGFGLILACIAGRMWSILYVGSRKNRELTTIGPYSITRNPLYFFSTLGAVGVGLAHGSILLALALGLFAYLVLTATAMREAEHLKTLFGPQYDSYARDTPLFWPKPWQYSDAPEVAFSPAALRRTFLDCLFFLAAFPIIEAIERLQVEGVLPVFARIF